MKRSLSILLIIALTFNLVCTLTVNASSIIFCSLDFEDEASAFGGFVRYQKTNSISREGSGNGHYAVMRRTTSDDCHMDYVLEVQVDKLVCEADFYFEDMNASFNPFYFIGSALDNKTRVDISPAYVGRDLGFYINSQKKYTFQSNKYYKISVAVNLKTRTADIYVNRSKLTSYAITLDDFQRIKTVRTWLRNDGGNAAVRIDNYRIYESDVPSDSVFDEWETIFPDDGVNRASAQEILSVYNSRQRSHPSLYADRAAFNEIMMSSDKAAWYKKIRNAADDYLSKPVAEYELADSYRLLPVSREVLYRMELWGFAYQLTKNDKYYNRAMQDVNAICSFKDWHAEHIIDTAEMMTAAAAAYDWFYERMSDAERKTLSEAIIAKGLTPIKLAYYGKLSTGGVAGASMNFTMSSNNMNIVTNCGAIVAAISVFDCDKNLCSDIIEKALRSLAYSMPEFRYEGSWAEGINYWNYAMEYISRAMGALDANFGTSFGLSDYTGLDVSARWAISLDSYKGVNSYHDTWNGMHIDTFALSWLGRKYNDKAVQAFRKKTVDEFEYMPSVFDMLWCDTSASGLQIENDKYTKNAETVSVRESWFKDDGKINDTGLFFSAHGGMNNSYHSHVDAGAFVFDIDGERWAMDIVPEDYNKMYANDYSAYYRRRAEGHNTLVINPSANAGQKENAFSGVTDIYLGEKDAYAVYDMSAIYSDYVSRYNRGFYVGDNRRSLTVRDELSLKNSNSTVYWFMHTEADIEPAADGAILSLNGKKLRLTANSNAAVKVSAMKAEPLPSSPNPSNQTPNDGINKVAIALTGSGNIELEVKLSPYYEEVSAPMNSSMSTWKKRARASEGITEYDFEDYNSTELPSGFKAINPNSITTTCPGYSVFGAKGRSFRICQSRTAAEGADRWYQARAEVTPVYCKYQLIHFEQAYDNQFQNRWLALRFNDNNETKLALFNFRRDETQAETPMFAVNEKSFGINPIKLNYWNSFDILINMEKRTYDMYVNGVKMANNIALTLKYDKDITSLCELQFGVNHLWSSADRAFALSNTYIDNIITKAMNEEPQFNSEEIQYYNSGVAAPSGLCDTVVCSFDEGDAVLAKYSADRTLLSVMIGEDGKLSAPVYAGEHISIMNWDSISLMKSLRNKTSFDVK